MKAVNWGVGLPSPPKAYQAVLFGIAAAGFGAPAFAAGTVAGTPINNIATATYGLPGAETTINSNTVSLIVDELLDVSVALASPGDVITSPGATGQVLAFTLTNAGNGSESFVLATREAIGGDQFDPSVTSIILDANGNGAYDPGVDTVYVAGSNDPLLAADGQLAIFVLSSIPGGALDGDRGQADLTAVAATGSGAPGASFPGLGQGGGDAVVGATGADGEAGGFYAVSAATLSFLKSAAVVDPFGGATQVPGATITYTLTATVNGSGSLFNVRVADPIPADATYTAASIRLDGTPLTDAADADAGAFDGTGIGRARQCRRRHDPHDHLPGPDQLTENMMKYLLPLIALLAPVGVQAMNGVTLASNVFVERVKQDSSGKSSTVLEPPRVVTPGDRLLFELSYRNGGAEPATDFVVTNPIPDAVAYAGADSDSALVSVDGGRSWGALAALRIKQADGTMRAAAPADVTHVRWNFRKAIAAGEAGKLSFRGIVK